MLRRDAPTGIATYHTGMDLTWDVTNASTWQGLHARCGGALQQSWNYGEALRSLGVPVYRAMMTDTGEPVALAQFMVRRIAGYLSLASCSRGPVFSEYLDAPGRNAVIRQIRRSIPTRAIRVSLFGPNGPLDAVREEVRGLKRVLTGHSTVLLDLTQTPEQLRAALEGKWRNRLVRAESNPALRVQINASRSQVQWLLEREREQRAARHFLGLPTSFVEAWMDVAPKPAKAVVLASAISQGQTVAAMLFLLHGRVATYHIGWADPTGRELNAHNLLLWRAMQHLSGQGFTALDLGGVNTHALPGISRFKIGTGGQVLTLAGTYF